MPRATRSRLMPEELAKRELDEELQQAIAEIVAELGPAVGSVKASPKDELRLWGIRDEKVDPDAMLQRLLREGYPPELLDPENEQALMVVQENPELAPYYAEPTQDQELADALVRLAEWPFRLGILRDLEDDPEEQVKKAESLDAAWQKSLGESPPLMQEPTAPAAPAMPMADPMMQQAQPPQQPMAPQMPADMTMMMGG